MDQHLSTRIYAITARTSSLVYVHIARYSTASKCTLYCIVGDEDVYLKHTKYITTIVCTPLTLLHDVENGMVEVLEVLSP